MQLYITLFGLLFIILGTLSIYKPTAQSLIRLKNSLNGTQTKITKATLVVSQIGGVVAIVMGISILMLFNK